MATISITGASGYLGGIVSHELRKNGHHVSGIDRKLLYGDMEDLMNEIKSSDVVINLAGAPILQRWTDKNKKEIMESRVKTTSNLVEAINTLPESERPKKFISASAIGIYKTGHKHSEESRIFDDGFLGEVVKDWEAASKDISPNVQRNIFRLAMVLGSNAAAVNSLLLPFKLGLGATIGNGKQAFSFVHQADVGRAFRWAVETCDRNGTFNLSAPENIDNKKFTKTLAQKLSRPAFFFIPKFAVKAVLGEAAMLLTEGAQAEPENLQKAGFKFKYPDIESALEEIAG